MLEVEVVGNSFIANATASVCERASEPPPFANA